MTPRTKLYESYPSYKVRFTDRDGADCQEFCQTYSIACRRRDELLRDGFVPRVVGLGRPRVRELAA